MPHINPLSRHSLLLEVLFHDCHISTATGFVVRHPDGRPFLITNRHVVTGRDEANRPTGLHCFPTALRIYHHVAGHLGTWIPREDPLTDASGTPRWHEHPLGSGIDVVAFPLGGSGDPIALYPLDLALASADIIPEPAMPISIIGFPLGMRAAGALPIWKTGHIASDPDIDCDNKPLFLIDATTRGGMSGSPVVLQLYGGYRTRDGRQPIQEITRFLGVYSAQHEAGEIGLVWKPTVIAEILAQVP